MKTYTGQISGQLKSGNLLSVTVKNIRANDSQEAKNLCIANVPFINVKRLTNISIDLLSIRN